LGLLYVHYLLKNAAVKTLYLGADVPLSDLAFIVQHKNPDYLYAHLTGVANTSAFEKFLRHLHSRVTDTPVIISGYITELYKKAIPPNIHFKKSLGEVTDFLFQLS
jgi:methanogenic corrinoid protein MtbC1